MCRLMPLACPTASLAPVCFCLTALRCTCAALALHLRCTCARHLLDKSPLQYSQSVDGRNWTKTDGTNIMFPNMTTAATPAALFGGPTAILNGRRYATASPHQFCLFPPPVTSAVLMRSVSGYPAKLGPVFWYSQEVCPAPCHQSTGWESIHTAGVLEVSIWKIN